MSAGSVASARVCATTTAATPTANTSARATLRTVIVSSPLSADFFDDLARGDAVAVEQLLGLAAAWNLAHRETADGEALAGDGRGHRVANPADGIVILDGNQAALRLARAAEQGRGVDWLK